MPKTIQQPAPTPEGGTDADVTPVPESMSARDTMMQDIAERRRAELEESDPGLTQDADADAKADADAEDKADADAEDKADADAEDKDEQTVTVKIDGVKTEVPISTVVAGYQKNGAADNRLKRAAEAEKKVKADAAALAGREAEFTRRSSVPAAPVVDRAAHIKELSEALYDGDESALDAALNKVIPEPVAPTSGVDEKVLAENAARIAIRRINVGDAVTKYREDFPALAGNKRLNDWVDEETETIMRDDPSLSPSEVLQKAAKSVEEQVSQFSAGKQKPGNDLKHQEREEAKRKAASEKLPIASAVRAKLGKDAPPPPTNSDVIKSMRKARGQPDS